MIKADVNLSILFDEFSLVERPGVAPEHGFVAAELWWRLPESVPIHGKLRDLAEAFENAGVRLVGLNFDAGDLAAGDRGLTSLPGQEKRLRENVDVAMEFAEPLECRAFNAVYGNRQEGTNPVIQDELAIENLCYAAEPAHRINGVVLIESQNSADSCLYPLPRAADEVDVVERVEQACGASNVTLLADRFHVHRMGDDLTDTVRTFADRIGHVQIADDPGRHQTGTGKIDFGPALAVLSESDCQGYIGLEYWPLGLSAQCFGWGCAWTLGPRASVGRVRVDHVKLMDAFGYPGRRVTRREEVRAASTWARAEAKGFQVPVLVEVMIDREANAATGASIDNTVEFDSVRAPARAGNH